MINPIEQIREDLAFYKRLMVALRKIAENPIILWWNDQDFRYDLFPAIKSHTLPLHVPMQDEEVLAAVIHLTNIGPGGIGSNLLFADDAVRQKFKKAAIILLLAIVVPLLIFLALASSNVGFSVLTDQILFLSLMHAVCLPLGFTISVGLFLDKLKMIPEIGAGILFFFLYTFNFSTFFKNFSIDATPLLHIGIFLAGFAISAILFFLVTLYGTSKIRRLLREKRLKTT